MKLLKKHASILNSHTTLKYVFASRFLSFLSFTCMSSWYYFHWPDVFVHKPKKKKIPVYFVIPHPSLWEQINNSVLFSVNVIEINILTGTPIRAHQVSRFRELKPMLSLIHSLTPFAFLNTTIYNHFATMSTPHNTIGSALLFS